MKLFSATSVYQCELINTDTTLLQKVDELSARVVALETENRLLRQKLDQYIRHYFGGSRNEGLDKHQLELLLQGLPNVITLPAAELKTTTATRNGAAHPVRRMLAEDKLEMQEIVIEPMEVQAQPDGWKKISEERTSQLDWVAPKIIKRVYIRPRYVKQERFALAPLPPQPIEQGMVGPGLLAQILVSKYEYHQPLYRQEKMFRWEALTRFADDGVLEIDNNLIENAIRPSALGKKNWLFVGHPEAGERNAVIYTLLGGCRRHGINPFDYLKDLFTRLPAAKITQIKEFTPAAWAKAKEKMVDQAA